ncbi:MAG: GntR family transcriptional regulator [Anaerolineaceae bacterium]|nr:MAG: GntR family transcriptional regulator [Anaerolineaceae bacterium]
MTRPIPLSHQAYKKIKQMIVTLELPPGSVIDEAELQEALKMGRTPIREALKRLALESLVSIVPRRGMFVTNIGVNDLQRLLEVRLDLETLATRLAASRGTQEHWKRMEQLVVEPTTMGEENDKSLIHLDETFHEIIYEAADNRFLHDAITVLLTLNERLWYYFLPEMGGFQRTLDDHRLIWESLKSGDGEQAAAQMKRHILSSQEKLQSVVLGDSP